MSRQDQSREDPHWKEKYADLLCSVRQAVSRIRPGNRVFIGTGGAQPQALVKALVARSGELADVTVLHLLTIGDAPYAHKELVQHFRVNSFFIAENVRDVIQEALGDYTPIFLSDIPRLFSSGRMPLDAALIQVSPPDERGLVSLGISVDIVKSAAENAGLVIAQVNPRMPRTLGDSFLHVHDLDFLVPVDEPLLEVLPPRPGKEIRRIGEYVAALVDDGCTVELGIGRVPQAVLEYLAGKKDLGIHTEMFTDAIIDLVESGVVNGSHKSLDRGKVVASFCLGSKRLYDYLHDNPQFAFHPTEYVNDPFVISRQHRQVAINVALEVDLTGQVCADSIGTRFFSGIGGQVDFNRGAARSRGGKAIIAMPSTAGDGSVSRIVSHLSPGAGVVTTRGDVHYVVTEYGVAYLHGKSVQERAMALISIAHPDFRERLLREAIQFRYLRPEMSDVEGRLATGPESLRTTVTLSDGTQVTLRAVHPTDQERMRDLFYQLSQQSIYLRFMTQMKRITQQQLQNWVFLDHRKEVGIVATVPESHGDDLIGMGAYYLDPRTNRAEIAFMVRDDWQSRGLGQQLFRHLTTIARRNGIGGLLAETLQQNRPMQAIINNSNLKVSSTLEDGVYCYEMLFE